MMHQHNRDTVMRDALIVLSEKRDIEFIDSIIERLAAYAERIKASGVTESIKRDMIDLEYDLLVYSRMLPFKLMKSYPEADVLAITGAVDSYDNFSTLFAETFKYYATGDVARLPKGIRKHFEN